VKVKQTGVLTAAITSTATQLQQLLCLHFYTSGTVIQYFCFLAHTTVTGNATSELGTAVMTHQVWWMTAVPTLAMYGTNGADTALFNDASKGLNNSNSKGWVAFEATAAASGYGEEMTFVTSLPNPKMMTFMGNYVARDRKTIVTSMGWQGDADAGNTTVGDVNLQTGTLKTIKDGVTSTGFGGTAFKTSSAASTVSATAAFTTTDPNATVCTTMTEATCKSTYTLVKSGALSTIASVGAAIAALAMSF
jgi:hypothetical protein